VDRRVYLDVNRLATRTVWAHGVLAFLARPYALVIIAVLLLVALARARLGAFGGSDIDQLAALVWVAIGTTAAYALSLPVVHLVGRVRPFAAMPQAAVLISRPPGFSFPNEHAVIAGALAAGLWLSRARVLAAIATLVAIALGFAVVYAGTAYPGDALGGLLLGALVSLALYPLVIGSLRDLAHRIARSPLKFLVGGSHGGASVGPGPAARPEVVGESGAVRILSPDEIAARRPVEPEKAGPVRIVPPEGTQGVSILPPGGAGGLRILQPGERGSGPGASTAQG